MDDGKKEGPAEAAGEAIDTAAYTIAEKAKAEAKKIKADAQKVVAEVEAEVDVVAMDIKHFLEKERDALNLDLLQVEAFCHHFRGKILSLDEWRQIIKDELTRRA